MMQEDIIMATNLEDSMRYFHIMIVINILVVTTVFVHKNSVYADELVDEIDHLIELIDMNNPQTTAINRDAGYLSNIRAIIKEAAYQYQLDPLFIEAIIKVESNFDPYAVSQKGAMGLMQLMPETAKEMGVTDPFSPYQNIRAGTYYYRLMLDRYRNPELALHAYNCGPECVENGEIPYETIKYAKKVLRTYKSLRSKGGYYGR